MENIILVCVYCGKDIPKPNRVKRYCSQECRIESIPAKTKQYREKNREAVLQKNEEYRQKNKEYYRQKRLEYYYRKNQPNILQRQEKLADIRAKLARARQRLEELEKQEAQLLTEIEALNANASSQETTGETPT